MRNWSRSMILGMTINEGGNIHGARRKFYIHSIYNKFFILAFIQPKIYTSFSISTILSSSNANVIAELEAPIAFTSSRRNESLLTLCTHAKLCIWLLHFHNVLDEPDEPVEPSFIPFDRCRGDPNCCVHL